MRVLTKSLFYMKTWYILLGNYINRVTAKIQFLVESSVKAMQRRTI